MLVQYLLSCPSVRLSQVGVLLRRLNLWSHKQSRMICPETLTPKICWKFQWGQPERSLYLRNDARYGRQIGTPMHSIEWHNFQWPWVTLTHDLAPFSTFSIVFCIFVTSGDGNLADVLILSGASPRITNHPWKGRGLAICLRYSYNWTDLNQTWTHIQLWLLFEKNWSKLSGHLLTMAKTFFWDRLWTLTEHILQRNMVSTIGKKVVNLRGLPYMPPKFGELWSRKGWERLASFCPPLLLYFCIGRLCQPYRMDVI